MQVAIRNIITFLALFVLGWAFWKMYTKPEPPKPCEPEVVTVLTGSVKVPYLNDSRITALLKSQCLAVKTEKSGVLADDLVKVKSMDAAWPVGANMAESYARLNGTQIPVATTVMGIASWQKIADLLTSNGFARKEDTHYVVSLPKFLPELIKGTKWSELKDNKELPLDKAMVLSMPNIRASQTTLQAMLQFSYVLNNNKMVDKPDVAAKLANELFPLFTRQGFQENTLAGPFEDYVASPSVGKIPLVLAYESQFIEALSFKSLAGRHTFLYLEPAMTIKHTWVGYSPKGIKLGEFLSTNLEAQKIAAEYGMRTTRPAVFDEYLKKLGRSSAYLDSQVDLPPEAVIQELNKTIVSNMLTQQH